MSGDNQHYIPELLLKGFRIPNWDERVWKFTRNRPKPTRRSSIRRVAADPNFYSKLSTDGSKTLDDHVTDYETEFANRLFSLRAIPAADNVDPAVAAEVVTHLIVRNAHFRDTFGAGTKSLMNGCRDLFGDEASLRRLLGIDAQTPPSRLQKLMVEVLRKEPAFAELGLPEPVLFHVAFTLMNENFDQFSAEQTPLIFAGLGNMAGNAKDLVRKG